jgi:hypothetical protein
MARARNGLRRGAGVGSRNTALPAYWSLRWCEHDATIVNIFSYEASHHRNSPGATIEKLFLPLPEIRQHWKSLFYPRRKSGSTGRAFSTPAGNPAALEKPFLPLPEIRQHWKSLFYPCRKSGSTRKAFSTPAGNPAAPKKPFLPLPEIRQGRTLPV